MRAIRRFHLVAIPEQDPIFKLDLPKGAELLCVQLVGGARSGRPYLYAVTDDKQGFLEPRYVRAFEDNEEMLDGLKYLGTLQPGPLTWHFFEVLPPAKGRP